MYHYDPSVALDELREEVLLPNPVHVRDMMLRTRLTPEQALDLHREFQAYQSSFAEAQRLAGGILAHLADAAKTA